MLDPELESSIRKRFAQAAFSDWMGTELVSMGDGESEIRLELQPHHLNPGGIAHGGVIASVLDMAIGVAHRTKLGMVARHVTVQLNINYLRPARAGTILARGNAIRGGERVGYGEATLLDEAGQTLARANATFLVVSGTLDGE